MTGNITIHEAEFATICGHIVFTLNFARTTHKLSLSDGLRLAGSDNRGTVDDAGFRIVHRDEVLELVRQGDTAMWTWHSFMATWSAWADGFHNAKARCST